MASPYPRFLTSGYFDAFSWVPTIQGNLFTKVLNTDSFDGQIDKHLVNFEFDNRTRPANNSRHIVGTFLIADIDRKPWPNPYSGVFRYILRGSINSGIDSNEFYNSLPDSIKGSDIKEFVQNSFVGELTILHNEYPDLPRLESEFLEQIRETEALNVEYDTARNEKAENIQGVNARRRLLNDSYMSLVNKVQEIEAQENDRFYRNDFPDSELKSNPYRIWKFRILLSEDGLLLIKNNTVRAFDKYISFTYSQYKKLPRPYKLAVVRVKHIFHKHYHHDTKNDTCITLSDTKIGKNPFEIATEQIRGLLLEIVKSKRIGNFAHIRSKGVIAYTNSL
jgi:hypothetical protein